MRMSIAGTENKPGKKIAVLASIAVIIILGCIIYGNSIDNEFVFDDREVIMERADIQSWSGALAAFGRWRPLLQISLIADYSLWGLEPGGYHLTNIVLHILVALSVYWLISILYDNRLLSLFAGVLFVSHPVQVETVALAANRADILVALFSFLCLVFYIKHTRGKGFIFFVLSLASYILALLSKENALIIPVLLLLYHYAFRTKFNPGLFLAIASIPFIGVSAMRIFFGRFPSAIGLFKDVGAGLVERIPGFFVAVMNYIRILLLPFGLHMEYGNQLFDFTDTRVIAGLIIVLFLLVYAAARRKTNRVLFFSVYWFFIALLPVTNVFPPLGAFMYEHWLYIPSFGFFLLVAAGLTWLYRREKLRVLGVALMALVTISYSFLAIKQGAYWNNPEIFNEWVLKYNPGHFRANSNLGIIYANSGRGKEAIPLFKRAIKADPGDATAYNNLGSAYSIAGRTQEAIAAYKKAIKIKPYYAKAYNNLGEEYSSLGQHKKAIDAYEKAIESVPVHAAAIKEAWRLGYHGRIERIKPRFEMARAYYNLGNEYSQLGRTKEALDSYEHVLELDPGDAGTYYNISLVYFREGRYEKAVEFCDRARGLGYPVPPSFREKLEPHRK